MLEKILCFIFVFTVHVMKVGNLQGDLETLLILKSQGIDSIHEVVLHLSLRETAALSLSLRDLEM